MVRWREVGRGGWRKVGGERWGVVGAEARGRGVEKCAVRIPASSHVSDFLTVVEWRADFEEDRELALDVLGYLSDEGDEER